MNISGPFAVKEVPLKLVINTLYQNLRNIGQTRRVKETINKVIKRADSGNFLKNMKRRPKPRTAKIEVMIKREPYIGWLVVLTV